MYGYYVRKENANEALTYTIKEFVEESPIPGDPITTLINDLGRNLLIRGKKHAVARNDSAAKTELKDFLEQEFPKVSSQEKETLFSEYCQVFSSLMQISVGMISQNQNDYVSVKPSIYSSLDEMQLDGQSHLYVWYAHSDFKLASKVNPNEVMFTLPGSVFGQIRLAEEKPQFEFLFCSNRLLYDLNTQEKVEITSERLAEAEAQERFNLAVYFPLELAIWQLEQSHLQEPNLEPLRTLRAELINEVPENKRLTASEWDKLAKKYQPRFDTIKSQIDPALLRIETSVMPPDKRGMLIALRKDVLAREVLTPLQAIIADLEKAVSKNKKNIGLRDALDKLLKECRTLNKSIEIEWARGDKGDISLPGENQIRFCQTTEFERWLHEKQQLVESLKLKVADTRPQELANTQRALTSINSLQAKAAAALGEKGQALQVFVYNLNELWNTALVYQHQQGQTALSKWLKRLVIASAMRVDLNAEKLGEGEVSATITLIAEISRLNQAVQTATENNELGKANHLQKLIFTLSKSADFIMQNWSKQSIPIGMICDWTTQTINEHGDLAEYSPFKGFDLEKAAPLETFMGGRPVLEAIAIMHELARLRTIAETAQTQEHNQDKADHFNQLAEKIEHLWDLAIHYEDIGVSSKAEALQELVYQWTHSTKHYVDENGIIADGNKEQFITDCQQAKAKANDVLKDPRDVHVRYYLDVLSILLVVGIPLQIYRALHDHKFGFFAHRTHSAAEASDVRKTLLATTTDFTSQPDAAEAEEAQEVDAQEPEVEPTGQDSQKEFTATSNSPKNG